MKQQAAKDSQEAEYCYVCSDDGNPLQRKLIICCELFFLLEINVGMDWTH